MAGTIIADFIRTDANQLSLNVGNTTFATINASGFFSNTGTQLIAANGKISGASIISGSILGSAISTAANTIPRSAMTVGSVLQVASNTTYSPQSMSITTSGTLVASGFVLPITPSSATSKILIMYTSTFASTSSNSGVAGNVQMYRNIAGGAYSFCGGGSYSNYWNTIATYIAYQQLSFSMMYLDSPGTTSQIIYQPYFNVSCGTAGGTGVLGGRNTDGLSYSGSHMVAMEIAA
jgi:hypothetical protein